jgi:hypothetical protein
MEGWMNFQIMQQDGGRNFIPAINQLTNKPLVYDCPKKAAEMAAKLSKLNGKKYQPRPVANQIDWHEREKKRFANGEYVYVLWTEEPWWKDIDGHFAHVGVKDKTRIAFTPDAEKGAADRQTAMLPGKYLQQFFGDVLSADEVREFAMQHATKFETIEFKWAKTAKEIEHVYKVGPTDSCFSKSKKANLYASGDFAVAYLEDGNGRVTARALCVPEKKIYPHIYGDRLRLKEALTKAGYSSSTNGNDYSGLRLVKKDFWDGWYADWYPSRRTEDDPKDNNFLLIKS